ncbi:uncharacterized protein PG986_012727 [Apiospora aurea]|uniref:Uncharacterized protein n=1 Tax=Apiospora aurea TaxID=335848 RepID=A0ABR1Q197_9PEZI
MVSARASAIGMALTLLWATASGAPTRVSSLDARSPGEISERAEASLDSKSGTAEEGIDLWADEADQAEESETKDGLEKRAKGDKSDPYNMVVDVSQRGRKEEAPYHRRDAGTNTRPFYTQNLAKRQTTRINAGTTSAEEFPWASMMAGGAGAHLMSAEKGDQDTWSRTRVPYEKYARITFQGYDKSRTYCKALFSKPPDFSVCGNRSRIYGTLIKPRDYDYVKVQNSNPVIFKHP